MRHSGRWLQLAVTLHPNTSVGTGWLGGGEYWQAGVIGGLCGTPNVYGDNTAGDAKADVAAVHGSSQAMNSMMFMPFMFGFRSFLGLALYWVTNNLMPWPSGTCWEGEQTRIGWRHSGCRVIVRG